MEKDMPTTAIALFELAGRLARGLESDRHELGRVYETWLRDLKKRRKELAAQLGRVDAEIQAVTQQASKLSARPIQSARKSSQARSRRGTRRAVHTENNPRPRPSTFDGQLSDFEKKGFLQTGE